MNPPLSVVVATTQPWPEVRMTLESVYDQAVGCGAEVIIVDSTGGPRPPEVAERFPAVEWIARPGVSSSGGRTQGFREAQGDLVALTEDHVRVAPDWCERILAAHARHPEAIVIGGTIDNGCPDRLRDWAHHFLVFGPAVSPIEEGPGVRVSGAANLAFDRRAVEPHLIDGDTEMALLGDLARLGTPTLADGSIRVHHIQPFPFATLLSYHFHNGRTMAGRRLRRVGPLHRLARLAGCLILPAYLVALRVSHVWPKRNRRRKLIACLPWLAAMSVAQSAGEAVGYLRGPGDSPQRLR